MVLALSARDKLPSFTLKPPVTVPSRPHGREDQLAVWLKRGATERFIVEVDVTPELARLLLDRNDANRLMSVPAVETYAAAMRRGEWRINGENIIVAQDGNVNDGQHRLNAVIEADMPVRMAIQFGIARETRSTLNTGRKRTLGDHFTMARVANANLAAAITRLAWCYDHGVRSFQDTPSVDQAFAYLKANPRMHEFFGRAASVGSQFRCGGAKIGFAAYVCSRINHTVSSELLDRVHDGLGLTSTGSPAYRVRERLLLHSTGQKELTRNEEAAVFIKAFNAGLGRRKCRALTWTYKGDKAEPFPTAGE